MGLDGQPSLTRFRYLGMRLQDVTSMADGQSERIVQQKRYQYDAFGQVRFAKAWNEELVKMQQWLAKNGMEARPVKR